MIETTGQRQLPASRARCRTWRRTSRAVVLDPPDRTFADVGDHQIPGGRAVELTYLGRGHTDNDIVVRVPDANVLFAGDLLENDATPYFGDGFPMDWPATAEALVRAGATGRRRSGTRLDRRPWVRERRQMTEFRAVAELASLVHDGRLAIDRSRATDPLPRRRRRASR